MEYQTEKHKYKLKNQSVLEIPSVYTSVLMGFLAAFWNDNGTVPYDEYDIDEWFEEDENLNTYYELQHDLMQMAADGFLDKSRHGYTLSDKGLMAAMAVVMFES